MFSPTFPGIAEGKQAKSRSAMKGVKCKSFMTSLCGRVREKILPAKAKHRTEREKGRKKKKN